MVNIDFAHAYNIASFTFLLRNQDIFFNVVINVCTYVHKS